jgi:hypothetical protein
VAKVFFAQVWNQAEQANLTSDEHFTVDGTLLEACASLKSFQKKGKTKIRGSGRSWQSGR